MKKMIKRAKRVKRKKKWNSLFDYEKFKKLCNVYISQNFWKPSDENTY